VIPPEVRAELLAEDAPGIVRTWARQPPDWIVVQATIHDLRDDPRWRSLDLGERAALALAAEHRPAVLLIDERAGRAIAHGLDLPVTGTLGVLDEAARRKLISLPDMIERLKRTSFRYPKAVGKRLMEEDGKRS
jgi:predicted nucleic acid-binding protein